MYIFKIFMNYAKEEKWLDKMSRQGYKLTNASAIGYRFVKIVPEDATYKIDYRTFKSKENFIDYCSMFEDSGWLHITGTRLSGNQYFKKIIQNSEDDIFSDTLSKASRYSRASKTFITMALSYLPLIFILNTNGYINLSSIANPKLLYYTPGLWEKSGAQFISSFLFETPFVLMRVFIFLFFPIMILLYTLCAYKSNKLYKESLK